MPPWDELDKGEKDAWLAEAQSAHPEIRDTRKLADTAKRMYTENFG